MGLFDKKNIDKVKGLAEKNKDKIADGVDKATNAIDKKTGGKHRDKLKKLDDAAGKFAGRTPGPTASQHDPVNDPVNDPATPPNG